MKTDNVIPIANCERCKQLEARLAAVEMERDELSLALARERQRANAIFLQFPTQPTTVTVQVPVREEAPLRHKVVDRLNDQVKKMLPFLHVAAKRAANLTSKLK